MIDRIFNNNKLICGIDLGSSRLKVVAGISDRKGRFSRLEYVDVKSQGIEAGVITDISVLTRSLKQAIKLLEKKVDRKIKQVYVNTNGKNLSFRHTHALMPLCDRGNKIVTNSDINLVNSHARSLSLKFNEEIVHDFPYRYILDDHNKVYNPKGLYGHKLAADLYLIVSKLNHIENIVKLINQSGMEIEDIVFSGLAASLAVLDDNQREEGTILIDIGSELTQILVFKDKLLRSADILKYGGNNIAVSISEALKVPLELAEEIKVHYGSATSKDIKENEEIMIKKDDDYKPIRRRVISGVIEPEVAQLLTRIKEKINASSDLLSINYSVVIVGGTSLLDGFLELAESILGVPVRLGIPDLKPVRSKKHHAAKVVGAVSGKGSANYNKDLHSLSNRAVNYATGIGLLQYALNLANRNKLVLFKSKDVNIITYLIGRVKDIYSGYF